MNREVALTLLSEMVAATSRPALVPDTVGALLDSFAAVDTEGRRPGDDGWEGTWDLNAAAAKGWRLKAGKVAGDFNFSADGASYSKADVLAQCLEMETRYASLSHGYLQTLQGAPRLPTGWDGTQVP